VTTDTVWIVKPAPKQLPAAEVEQVLARLERQLERIAVALERWVDAVDGVDEPEEAEEARTLLPEDFPGREMLAMRGVIYLEDLPRTGARLAALGLDGVTVNQVLVRLKRDG
jgi:hypothetical protein